MRAGMRIIIKALGLVAVAALLCCRSEKVSDGHLRHVDPAVLHSSILVARQAAKRATSDREYVERFDRALKDDLKKKAGVDAAYLPIDRRPSSDGYYSTLRSIADSDALNHTFGYDANPTKRFPEAVALKNGGGWICSGVLLARNALVSAKHCFDFQPDGGKGGGEDLNLKKNIAFSVILAGVKPACIPSTGLELCVAVLPMDVGTDAVPVIPEIATSSEVDSAQELSMVGYGAVDNDGAGTGVKREGLIGVLSPSCNRPNDPADYGCIAGLEIVASGRKATLDYDGKPARPHGACDSDSGGPIFVETTGVAHVAAIASYISNKQCSNAFNVYMRLDTSAVRNWLRCVEGVHWENGVPPTGDPCPSVERVAIGRRADSRRM